MTPAEFCQVLKRRGFNFASGVPCSILGGVIDCLSDDPEVTYVPATREDEAIGIATGAYLAGKKPLVLMQNSGLGNCINALTSLVLLYKIPLLLLVSWRGEKGDDTPEHIIMGDAMMRILDNIGLEARVSPKESPLSVIRGGDRHKPVALILRREIFE